MADDDLTRAEEAQLRAVAELTKAQQEGDDKKAGEMSDLLGLVAKQQDAVARRKRK